MSEVKLEVKTEIESHSTENSSQIQQVKTEVVKSECPDSPILKQNTKQVEIVSNKITKRKTIKNGLQVEKNKSEGNASLEFEELSPLSSPKGSEFSISSIESFHDEVENIIICVGNELAYQNYKEPEKNDLYKKNENSTKRSESYKDFVRRCDGKHDGSSSRQNRVMERSDKCSERNRSRDNNRSRNKYSSERDRSRYSSSRLRRSRSCDRSRSRYTSDRSRRSRSWDRSRRYRDSRSPKYRTKRSRRRTRSRSRSRSYNSPKLNSDKRGTLTKKRRLSPDSPPHTVWKLLDRPKSCNTSIINRLGEKSASPKAPPLPASPPPPKPPPPLENNTVIPQPPLPVNNVTNSVLPPQPWIHQEYQHLQNIYPFPNPSMPNVSVNNLPLVPGYGNLPVHVTMMGEQILHDMDGRPIPVGPNGRLLPLDLSGRLYPHIVFPYNNQAVPIYMTEDGVLRLPNGEPVPYGPPNQLPVNIDGSLIPIGPDSRPLYSCPNIPRQNPLISPQINNPSIPGIDTTEKQQHETNPPSAVRQISTNSNVNQRFKQTKLPPAVIQIETVSDVKLKENQTSPNVNKIKTKTHSMQNRSDAPAEAKTTPTGSPLGEPLPKSQVVNSKVERKKLYEDVDLPKLVEKFSETISKINIRAIYEKKIQGIFKKGVKPPEAVDDSNTDRKSGPAVVPDANLANEPICSLRGAKDAGIIPSNSNKGNIASAEESLLEKKFTQAIQEAILLFAEIDFRPPISGRFLFSSSSTNFKSKSSPNESPLLRDRIKLPFLTPENVVSRSKKRKSPIHFRFVSQNYVGGDGKAIVPVNFSFAVQCDFTSKRIKSLHAKIEKLRRELFMCRNQNAELTDLYKFVREENKKKTEELNKIMKKMEEKNKIIRDLSQPRK